MCTSYTVLSFLRKFNLKITERLLASLVPYQAKTVSSKQINVCLSHFPALLVSLMPDVERYLSDLLWDSHV